MDVLNMSCDDDPGGFSSFYGKSTQLTGCCAIHIYVDNIIIITFNVIMQKYAFLT